jgi:hypothetical protein
MKTAKPKDMEFNAAKLVRIVESFAQQLQGKKKLRVRFRTIPSTKTRV